MIKNKLTLIVILLLLALLLIVPISFAENVAIPNDDIMLINEPPANIDSANMTNSDLYLFGTNINITTPVNGNVFVFGSDVTIDSNILGNVFVSALNVTITENSNISGSIFCNSDILTIKGVVSDVYANSSNINIYGFINRDLKSFCKNLNINGSIGRDVSTTITETLTFSTDDNITNLITGNFNYSSAHELSIPEGKVEGSVNFNPQNTNEQNSKILISLVSFISTTILIYFASILLAKKFFSACTLCENKQIFKKLGLGILIPILIIIFIIILGLLNFTLSFAVLTTFVFIILFVISSHISIIILSINIFEKIKDKLPKKLVEFYKFFLIVTISLIVWALSTYVPYLGNIILILLTLFGIGSVSNYFISNIKSKNVDN